MDIKKLFKQIAAIQKFGDLTTWEQDFVKSIIKRADKWCDDLHVSYKQAAILTRFLRNVSARAGIPPNRQSTTPFPVSDELPV